MWAFNENHGDNQALQVGCRFWSLLYTPSGPRECRTHRSRPLRMMSGPCADGARGVQRIDVQRAGLRAAHRRQERRAPAFTFHQLLGRIRRPRGARIQRIVTSGLARGDRKWPLNDGQIPNSRGVRVHVSTGLHSFRGDSAGVAKRSHLVSDLPPDTPDVTIRNFFASLCAVPSLGTVYAIWLHKAH